MKYREKTIHLAVTVIVRCRYDSDAALSEVRKRLVVEPPWFDFVSSGVDGSFSVKSIKTKSVRATKDE